MRKGENWLLLHAQLECVQGHASSRKATSISLELLQYLLNLLSAAPEVSARGVSAPFLHKIAEIIDPTCSGPWKLDPQVGLPSFHVDYSNPTSRPSDMPKENSL